MPARRQAGIVCVHDGILCPVRHHHDDGIGFDVQVGVALQADRAGQPKALRHDQMAAAARGQVRHRLGESLGVEGLPVPHAPEIRQPDGVFRDDRPGDDGHLERQVLVEVGEFVRDFGLGGNRKRCQKQWDGKVQQR